MRSEKDLLALLEHYSKELKPLNDVLWESQAEIRSLMFRLEGARTDLGSARLWNMALVILLMVMVGWNVFLLMGRGS